MSKIILFVFGVLGLSFYLAYDFIINLLVSPVVSQLSQITQVIK